MLEFHIFGGEKIKTIIIVQKSEKVLALAIGNFNSHLNKYVSKADIVYVCASYFFPKLFKLLDYYAPLYKSSNN